MENHSGGGGMLDGGTWLVLSTRMPPRQWAAITPRGSYMIWTFLDEKSVKTTACFPGRLLLVGLNLLPMSLAALERLGDGKVLGVCASGHAAETPLEVSALGQNAACPTQHCSMETQTSHLPSLSPWTPAKAVTSHRTPGETRGLQGKDHKLARSPGSADPAHSSLARRSPRQNPGSQVLEVHLDLKETERGVKICSVGHGRRSISRELELFL